MAICTLNTTVLLRRTEHKTGSRNRKDCKRSEKYGKKGLLIRCPKIEDKRSVGVYITDAGKEIVEDRKQIVFERVSAMLDKLGPKRCGRADSYCQKAAPVIK